MTNVVLPAEMHCRSCEQRIQRALDGVDGVRSVTTDLRHQRVGIEFDDERVDETELRSAVANASSHGDIGG